VLTSMSGGAASGNAHLDRRRSDGPTARIYGLEWHGADGAQRESIFRPCVCVSWAARRSDQDVVVGRRWSLSLCKKIGARKIYLAASDEWNGFTDAGTVVDVA
jgi:hypothetical protein